MNPILHPRYSRYCNGDLHHQIESNSLFLAQQKFSQIHFQNSYTSAISDVAHLASEQSFLRWQQPTQLHNTSIGKMCAVVKCFAITIHLARKFGNIYKHISTNN